MTKKLQKGFWLSLLIAGVFCASGQWFFARDLLVEQASSPSQGKQINVATQPGSDFGESLYPASGSLLPVEARVMRLRFQEIRLPRQIHLLALMEASGCC